MNNYETELAAAIEHGRAILAERQRQEDERRRQQEREAEERRQKHLAKLPEWARAFATVSGGNYEDYIKVDLPGCAEIYFKSTSYNGNFDSACVYIADELKFDEDRWIVAQRAHWLTESRNIDDVFAEAVAIAASHYDALCQMQADADVRNALPVDESPY